MRLASQLFRSASFQAGTTNPTVIEKKLRMRFEKDIRVAILVPTKDRSEFVGRLLNYYASVKSPHTLYIGDASQDFHLEKTKEAIAKFSEYVSIVHFSWTDLSTHETMPRLAEEATETYCAFIGDDDFLVPDSLTKCAQFLKSNPDYRTAQGKALLFKLEEAGPYGKIDGHGGVYWDRKESHWETARERMFEFTGGGYWVPQYSVHRREEFIADASISRISEDGSFSELTNCFVSIGRGKSQFVDCLYLFRQGHGGRSSFPRTYEWIIGEKWSQSVQEMSAALEDVLVEVDRLTRARAQEVARDIVLTVVKQRIQISSRSGRSPKELVLDKKKTLLEKLRMIPALVKLVRSLDSVLGVLSARSGRLSVPAMKQRSSPYHRDFMPVLDALTKKSQ